ncbi:MAG: tetratricopeptide repeat protein [Thermoplasmatota archaeon]
MAVIEDDSGYFFFQSPWKNIFLWHFMDTRKEALLVTPTIDIDVLRKLQSILISRADKRLSVRMLLRFSEEDFMTKELKPETLRILSMFMKDPSSKIKIRFMENLSMTAITMDGRKAILASGDLSTKKLMNDITYGILVTGSDIVEGIQDDLEKMWNSCEDMDQDRLMEYMAEIEGRMTTRKNHVLQAGEEGEIFPDLDFLTLGRMVDPLGKDRKEPHLDEEKKIIKGLMMRARDAVDNEDPTAALFYLEEALTISPDNTDLLVEKGKILFNEKKDFKGTLECCEKVLEMDSESLDAWSMKGMCLHEMGELEEALYAYDKATEIDPQYYPVWIKKGVIMGKTKGREEDGLKCLEYALSQDSYNEEAWFNKAQILEQRLGRMDEALLSYKSLLRINPKHVKGNFRMGLIYYKKHSDTKKAEKYFNRIIDVEPDHVHAWMFKGEIADQEDDFDSAFEFYENAVEANHNMPEPIHKEIDMLLRRKRKFKRAVTLAEALLEIKSNDSLALYVSGLGKMRIDEDYDSALKLFNQSIRADPANRNAIVGKANLLAEHMNKPQDAVKLLKAAIKKDEKDPSLWMELGLVYFDFLYEPKEGLNCFDTVTRIDKENADGWYNKGLVLSRGFEKHQEALNCLDQATKLDDDHNLAWYEKGRILEKTYGMIDDALKCYRKSIMIDPDDPEVLLACANVYSEKKDMEKAFEYFGKAIEADPSFIESYTMMATSAIKGKNFDKAHEILNQALQVDPKNDRIWMLKAQAFRIQGELTKSLECYKRVLRFNPENQDALNSKTSLEAQIEKQSNQY